MKKIHFLLSFIFTVTSINIFAQTISTYAGTGSWGYSGDGGQATNAELSTPASVAVDGSGNLYIVDEANFAIRKVGTSGIITTIAGDGTSGYSGDGGQATNAEIGDPQGIAVDKSGNIYIADVLDNCVRIVTPAGIINTFAGNGTTGYSGDGGAATGAELNNPADITSDSSGNLYIADAGNLRIRKVNASGIISSIAGNGTANYSGDGGPATAAGIGTVFGLGVDITGNLYLADNSHNVIRKINTSGIISTIAGNGTVGYSGDGGPATAAEFNGPWDVKTDVGGNVYISDQANSVIREVTSSGNINTIAGNGITGYSGDGGPATNAELGNPTGIIIDKSNDLYISDYVNSAVRKLTLLTSLNEAEASVEICNIYPNPSNGVFTLESLVESRQSKVEVYNILGEKVYAASLIPIAIGTSKGGNSETTVDLSSQPDGIYMLRITDATGKLLKAEKIVIVH